MAGWLKRLFGGGGEDTDAVKLDPPDVMEDRMEQTRLADLAAWQALKAAGPLPKKITRPQIETVLRERGFVKKPNEGESYFRKDLPDRYFILRIQLKSLSGTEDYAPSQRLLVSPNFCTHDYSVIETEVLGDLAIDPATMVNLGQRRFKEVILTSKRVEDILTEVEEALLKINPSDVLEEFCAYPPSRPGSGGIRHLCGLVCLDHVDRLDGYLEQRVRGNDCGFMPYITDDMIARAAQIGHRNG